MTAADYSNDMSLPTPSPLSQSTGEASELLAKSLEDHFKRFGLAAEGRTRIGLPREHWLLILEALTTLSERTAEVGHLKEVCRQQQETNASLAAKLAEAREYLAEEQEISRTRGAALAEATARAERAEAARDALLSPHTCREDGPDYQPCAHCAAIDAALASASPMEQANREAPRDE